MAAPRGWIAEAGRTNLGVDAPSLYAGMSAEGRRGAARITRWLTIGLLALSVVAIPVAWVLTTNTAARTIAMVAILYSDAIFIWFYVAIRRDIHKLDQAEQAASNPR